jgi:hypothetical protein
VPVPSPRLFHRRVVNNIVTEPNPVLDEAVFEKLLEAAYVLQEHNRKMRELEQSLESQSEQLREREFVRQAQLPTTKTKEESLRADVDYTLTLAQIVEAQHQIQIRHLELDEAMAVVAERVARIANANGAAVGILDGNSVRYRAGAGSSALPVGSEVPLATAICQANIRTGQVIRSEDVTREILFDPEPCLSRGILSLIAVPIYFDGDIVGALELYFDRAHGVAEQDMHTCQLMAGLVTEAIGRDAQSNLKKSMAAERSTKLAAIKGLEPDLPMAEDQPDAAPSDKVNGSTAPSEKFPCWKCGETLLAEEQFCGKCGASRASDEVRFSIQSKLASAWHMHQTRQKTAARPDGNVNLPDENTGNQPETFSFPEFDENVPSRSFSVRTDDEKLSPSSHEPVSEEALAVPSAALAVPQPENVVVWSSAAKARDFLESVSGTRTPGALVRFWRSRRGDFYLVLALILVAAVIRWGIWSESPVVATGHGSTVSGSASRRRQIAPDADLSAFDKLLISLGLAEAPDEAPEYKGNPDTQVWVDLHTALYYCPGSELYGKTPKGKMSSQRDAQLDQFEPAYRKACD